ncbi:FAD-dependent oxidoreductase [Agromyces soli]
MSPLALSLVLAAAVCHAAWNILAHGTSRIGVPFLWWGAVAASLLWLPLVPITGGLGTAEPWAFGVGVSVSALLHCGYMLAPGAAVGGAWLPYDLQANPRQALGAITAHLAALGVEFRFRTSVGSIESGLVRTSRGTVAAERVVVAANHDVDQLFPEVAEQHGIVRCGLDMLRVHAPLTAPLEAPLLTGWSLLRYGAFAETAAVGALRERLHAERPDLAALDLNQMYTQLPDGSLIVGDTHYRGAAIEPFQTEAAAEALLEEFETLFGVAPRVLERWQGVYASGREEFLDLEALPGVHLAAATTGIGMTTGLGLAEHVVAGFADAPAGGSTRTPTTTAHAPHERHHQEGTR